MTIDNIIAETDSYKLGHWSQYPEGTRGVYSYLEARVGAEYPETVFFGLQHILKQIAGAPATDTDLGQMDLIAGRHFGNYQTFNYHGWAHIVDKYNGKLPVRIKAVPEGTVVPVGNVLMTVENLDPECFWLTNALESLLLQVWYPTTVATRSYVVKKMLKDMLERTADNLDALPFMLHDFGYRSATSHESAAIGGLAHLVNFKGTDTVPALLLGQKDYGASLDDLGFSVPATEHSVMTSLGRAGEHKIAADIIAAHPTGILSEVADSYNIYAFVDNVCHRLKPAIMERQGKFVVRPDSTTDQHKRPEELVVWILNRLWHDFGGHINTKGYKVLDPHIGVLWGDGIDHEGIASILLAMQNAGFSAENIVFGMGGGLLQKLNRDTMRFAFKCSAQHRNGTWVPVAKEPLDATKASKKGRLCLVQNEDGMFSTVVENKVYQNYDLLQTVFEHGELVNQTTFDEVRDRAAL